MLKTSPSVSEKELLKVLGFLKKSVKESNLINIDVKWFNL